MKFQIRTDLFRKAIDTSAHATSTSNLTPILENILIEAKEDRVILTGNNLDMAIEYNVTEWINIESTGAFSLSSKILTSYIALVQDSEVTFELEWNGSATMSTGSWKIKLKWLESDKFPTVPYLESNENITLLASELKTAIDKTYFSTADSGVRPMLAGIFMNPKEEKLIFASTDSFRLSDYHIIPSTTINHHPIIIPKQTAQEISRLINVENENENITIHTNESQMMVEIWSVKLTSRLLSGKFPDYQNFFPKEYQTKTILLRSEFINALKQVNLIAKDNNSNIKIRSFSEWKIDIFTWDTEKWNSNRTIVATVEWNEDTIWINSDYLLAVLNVIREDYVSFEYKNPLSPIVIRWVAWEKKSSEEYQHLIMPLKI